MNRWIDNIYYIFLLLSLLVGLLRYRSLDKSARLILGITIVASLNELAVILFKYINIDTMILYHVYCIFDFYLTIYFFIISMRIPNGKILTALCFILLPTLEILNTKYFQPINTINSNMFAFESFCIIAMSLYSLYKILVDDTLTLLVKYPLFWFWVFFLIFNSCTFLFWAYIFPISRDENLINTAQDIQVVINIFVYAGLSIVFYLYPKMAKT